jgi:hypothetical protein
MNKSQIKIYIGFEANLAHNMIKTYLAHTPKIGSTTAAEIWI